MVNTAKYVTKLAKSICESSSLPFDSTDLIPTVDENGTAKLGAYEHVDSPKIPGERHGRPLGKIVYEITITAKWEPFDWE